MNLLQIVGALTTGNINGLINSMPPEVNQNPMARNVFGMAQKGDSNGLEQFARNLGREKNINIDAAYNATYNVVAHFLGQNGGRQ